MKRALILLALLPITAAAIPHQIRIEQKNAADTAWILRLLNNPPGTTPGIFFMDGAKGLRWVNVSSGLTYDSVTHDLTAEGVQSDWDATSGPASILNRPMLSAVALSGDYADLFGQPNLSAVAGTGLYSDLIGKPTLFDGTWGSLTGKPAWTTSFDGSYGSLTSIPSTFTPSAHTHAAADIVSGTLADARIPSLAISKTTGLQAALDGKFPNPAGTTAQYVRGDGTLASFPSTPSAYTIAAPTTRTLALATAYQCTNTAKPCLFTITLTSTSSISLSGTSNNEGQIVLGATNAVASGTGTLWGTYRNVLGGTLVIGLNLTSAQANTYTVPVPIGYYLAVRQTVGSGLTVVSAFDQVTQ